MIAHILGIPVEETFGQLAPLVAVTAAIFAILARTTPRPRPKSSKKALMENEA